MEIDTSVVDAIVSGETPAGITQSIKDLLYAKASERVDTYRDVVADRMFGGSEVPEGEVEEPVSELESDEEEVEEE